MIAERCKYRDLRGCPQTGLLLVDLIVGGIAAVVDQIPSDQNGRRILAGDPGHERAARDGVRHFGARGEARVAIDDKGQWRARLCLRHVEARRLLGRGLPWREQTHKQHQAEQPRCAGCQELLRAHESLYLITGCNRSLTLGVAAACHTK